MKSRMNYSIMVLATGFAVLVLLSLPLFWGRWLSETCLIAMMSRDCTNVVISPSGLVPPELENDPNVVRHSDVSASMRTGEPEFLLLGIADYFGQLKPEGRNSNIYYLNKDKPDETWKWIYFDEKIGQIACCYTKQERYIDGNILLRKVQLYAGPEGMSETSDASLGRFINPIADTEAWYARPFIIYDKQIRRFFKINFNEKTVTKGPELDEADINKPIQIGQIAKSQSMLNLYWSPPFLKAPDEGSKNPKPIVERDYSWDKRQYLLVLDETGRIDLLDIETLKFAGVAGHLPAPETLFPSKMVVTPDDLLAYEVLPLALKTDHKYRGMYAASVNREGTAITLAVFDEEGRLIRQKNNDFTNYEGRSSRDISTSKAVFWSVPWAPTLTISKYLLENLHPPILSLFSYFAAGSIEAGAGHRALFILPNSFIAMKGRDISTNMTERFFVALLIILPSIILAIILAWRIGEDAAVVGLSENAKQFWMLTTIAFGLAAYITYRLTRPKITQVTCDNCGKLRRPDMDRCHRCGSKWHVPELIPPTWRVIDAADR
jgi:hypothetical protein